MEALLVIGGYVFFIFVGQFLKLIGRLPPECATAISTLVLYVTLPCAILRVLNGTVFDMTMMLSLAAAFALSWVMIFAAGLMARGNKRLKDFARLNLPGWNIGTFSMPFTAPFVTPEGFLAICFFDMGNALMCTGGTYAFVCSDQHSSWKSRLKDIVTRLLSSGPIVTYLIVMLLMAFEASIPPGLMRLISIAADANSFLAMIMIGMSVNLAIRTDHLKLFARLLGWRYLINAAAAALLYQAMPFAETTRLALVLALMAPLPAVGIIFTMKARLDWQAAANLNTMSILISVVLMTALISLWFPTPV